MAIADDALDSLPVMEAEEIAPQIRDGDFFLCSGSAIFSKLIRWATKSDWSHVATALRVSSLDRAIVLESVEKFGVRATPFRTFVFGRAGRHPYPGRILWARNAQIAAAPPGAIRSVLDFALDQLGDPYDGGEVLKIALRVLHGSLNQKTPDVLKSQDEYICSEYVAQCFAQAAVKVPWDGRGFIAPCDFAQDPDSQGLAEVRTPHTPEGR